MPPKLEVTANCRGSRCSSSSIALWALIRACSSCCLRFSATRSCDRGVYSLYTPNFPVSSEEGKVMARFGCSPQAGSYRNKPRPSVWRTCVMHAKPFVPRNSSPSWTRHPVPPLVGEICKLCQIEHGAAGTDLELIALAGRMPSPARMARNAELSSALAVHPPTASWLAHQGVTTRGSNRLRAPLFELLRPSVVIRRRPQRD